MNKVLIFGDSILKGVTFDPERGYSLLREREISVPGCTVKNYSRMGATAPQGLEIVLRRLDEIDENTLVILEYGGNDSDHDWEQVALAPELDHRPRTEPEEFVRVMEEMARLCEKRGARVMTCSLPPISPERFFERICEGRDKAAVLRFLDGERSTVSRWQEHYGTLSDIRPGVDLRGAFILRNDLSRLISADGAHMTQKGFDLLRETLVRAIERVIRAPMLMAE